MCLSAYNAFINKNQYHFVVCYHGLGENLSLNTKQLSHANDLVFLITDGNSEVKLAAKKKKKKT